ncbi:MAG: DUF262 domain-containing protein [Chloroflexi bacterium]|nr:DUF262 domain-containing protein [Chloroflexota bacterium]
MIDKTYQRNAKVWPPRAQSYFIETILKGFPIPKLAVHQKVDLKSRRAIKYIVDGQQRTHAIIAFYKGELRLSRSLDLLEARGKNFDELSEDLQESFLAYPLYLDQFDAVGDQAVREYFRRINSFTAPLNPEERRNAEFQGNMKWLIHQMAERHSEALLGLGTLTEKEVIRKADQKLIAELLHALLNGVTTTSAATLWKMYEEYEKKVVDNSDAIERAMRNAFDRILGWEEVRGTDLVKKGYNLYSLVLALIGVETGWKSLEDTIGQESGVGVQESAEGELLELSDVLEREEVAKRDYYYPFHRATKEKTNTREQREVRVAFLARAIGSVEAA